MLPRANELKNDEFGMIFLYWLFFVILTQLVY